MATPSRRRAVQEKFSGIQRVLVTNRRETLNVKAGIGKTVAVSGQLTDPRVGLSVETRGGVKTLHLYGFHGTLTLPREAEVRLKTGVEDLVDEMLRTYAPSVRSSVLEARAELGRLGRSRSALGQQMVACLERMYRTTGLPLLTPQAALNQPSVLQTIEHCQLIKQFVSSNRDGRGSLAALRQRGERVDPVQAIQTLVRTVSSEINLDPAAGAEAMKLGDALMHTEFQKLRAARLGAMMINAWQEAKSDTHTKTTEALHERLFESLDRLDALHVPLAARVVNELGPGSGPISGAGLPPLIVTAFHPRSRGNVNPEASAAAARVGVSTALARSQADHLTAAQVIQTVAICTDAISEIALDGRFSNDPTHVPSADEVNRTLAVRDPIRARTQREIDAEIELAHRDEMLIAQATSTEPSPVATSTTSNAMSRTSGPGTQRKIQQQQQAMQKAAQQYDTDLGDLAWLPIGLLIGTVLLLALARRFKDS